RRSGPSTKGAARSSARSREAQNREKYRRRKAPGEGASHRTVYELVRFWLPSDRRDARADRCEELSCAPGRLLAIPAVSPIKIKLRFRCEAKPLHFRRA